MSLAFDNQDGNGSQIKNTGLIVKVQPLYQRK